MGKFGRLKQAWSSITGRLILGVVVVHLLLTPLLFYGILLIVQQSFESQFVDQVRNNTLLYLQLLTGVIEDGSEEDVPLHRMSLGQWRETFAICAKRQKIVGNQFSAGSDQAGRQCRLARSAKRRHDDAFAAQRYA